MRLGKITSCSSSFVLAVGIFLAGSGSSADPTPLSEAEMTSMADAIVTVEVVRVTKTSQISHQGTPVFIACMCIQEVQQGPLRVGQAIMWETAQYEVGAGESGGGLLYAGDRIKLFLKQQSNGEYHPWRDDCIQLVRRLPDGQRRLPKTVGESIYIRAARNSRFRQIAKTRSFGN